MFFRRSSRGAAPPPSPGRRKKLPTGASRMAIESLLDIQGIQDRYIVRTDGSVAALIEIKGEAFAMLTTDEQDLRIEAYGRVLNALQDGWTVQVTRMVEPTDLSPLADQFQAVIQEAGDHPVGAVAADYGSMVDSAQQHLVQHVTILTVWDKTPAVCQEKVQSVLNALHDNQFRAEQCDAERLGDLLQTGYGHPTVSLAATLGGWTDAIRRHHAALTADTAAGGNDPRPVKRADRDTLSVAADASGVLVAHMPTLRDVLEPSAVIEHPGFLDLGGTFVTTLVARTWPEQVANGWLEWLYTFTEAGVRRRVSFYIEPLSSARVMADLRRRQIQLDAETHWARKRGLREDFDVQVGEEAIEMLRQEIGRGRQRMFLATVFITLMADHVETLQAATQHLMQKANGYAMTLRPLYLEAALGFRATMPLGVQPVKAVPNRAVPTIALATTFPFSAGELLDPVGEVWGANRSTGNLVVLDPRRFQVKHLMVVAKTRSGKSATLKTLATQTLFRPGEHVMIIDPSPPIDYERWTRWMGGTYAQFSPGSLDGINPLEILLPASFDRLDETMRTPIRAKIAFGTELCGIMGRQPLTPAEQTGVEDVLTALFAAHGMPVSPPGSTQSEWETVYDPHTLSLTPRAKPAPTLTELYEALTQHADTQTVAQRIKPFVTGMFNMFAGATTVDMTKPLVVFNVHHLVQGSAGKQNQAVVYAMIAEFILWRLAQTRHPTFVIVDEGHVMFEREDTARFVSQLFRMAGKQGGRVALLTQGIVDIMGDPATGLSVPGQTDARYCIENSGFKLFLRNDNDADIELIMRTMGLTPAEGRAIRDAKHGQGILLIGDPATGTQRAFVQVLIPDVLYPWVTSDPQEVEVFRQQGVYDVLRLSDSGPASSRMVSPIVAARGE
ncbi:VirB4 family type IV secretion system protein [Sulfobacillus thermosulfidooxidans]|uniref:VirB4 family type IV secretion system protein n=1 Tax=Sulfobacillus thermosulfidooxidans TaxID=28034 RepID=UPI0002E522BC|nr:hypothetical protein [Sulfobacillus thermosulfidooxidans]